VKFHINNNNEAKRCRAKTDASCRFASNDENQHFSTQKEAEQEIERRNKTREKASQEQKTFNARKNRIATALESFGGIDKKNLAPVKNEKEMINKWFNEDKETFNQFITHVNNDKISDQTKKFIGTMTIKGLNIDTESKATDISMDKSWDTDSNISHLTFIEEDDDKETLDSILSGKEKAFSFSH